MRHENSLDREGHDGRIRRLHELVRGIQLAMLTTYAEDGSGLRSRPMTLQAADDVSGDLWFVLGRSSAMAKDVKMDKRVNLTFSLPHASLYVSLSGEAELIDDRQKSQELWTHSLKAWFPLGPYDPELTLLRVRVHAADYWEKSSGKMVQLAGLAKAVLTGRHGGEEFGERTHLGADILRAG